MRLSGDRGWPISLPINAIRRVLLCFLLFVLAAPAASAYSVLTHEEIVDLAWNNSILPLLKAKFPNATPAQLVEAHSYAYGGCAVQDMGYYPFGHKFFSDLTHYVRAGDFVTNLFAEAHTLNEYAFAIGALSHYLGDNIGHSEAINPSTAIDFPNLRKKYGPSVTYDESPHGHIRTEFGFDIDQLSKKRVAPPAYLDHVGFRVPRRLVERAFRQTYGINSHEILGRLHPAVRSYRWAVRAFIPAFAEAEVVLHRRQFLPDTHDAEFAIYERHVNQITYERHWKHAFKGPGIRAHLLAFVVWIVPKVGPLSLLAIKIPNSQSQQEYVKSVDDTLARFESILNSLKGDGKAPALPDLDLDTGKKELPGAYRLTDQTFAELLKRLTSVPNRKLPPGAREHVLAFYSQLNARAAWEREGHDWAPIAKQLAILKGMKLAGVKSTQAASNDAVTNP
jgi:hypothetical protein